MSIPQAIQSYLEYLKFQKHYSKHTLLSYGNDLTSFFDFLELTFKDSTLNVKPVLVRSWLASLKEEGMSSRSIGRKISSLKTFYKYLLKNGMVETSPMAAIITPKIKKALPQYVETKDIESLFRHAEFSPGFAGKTESMLMEILYNTGIRQAELISLKEGNIDHANHTIKVLGKGSKERIIPISKDLAEKIKEYISDKRRDVVQKDPGFLLINAKGKCLYPKMVYNIVKKYLSLVTTIERKGAHAMRHTFATHLSNNGAELNAVKELLGHSSLAATQVYTHNSIRQLKEIYKKAHPKGE